MGNTKEVSQNFLLKKEKEKKKRFHGFTKFCTTVDVASY